MFSKFSHLVVFQMNLQWTENSQMHFIRGQKCSLILLKVASHQLSAFPSQYCYLISSSRVHISSSDRLIPHPSSGFHHLSSLLYLDQIKNLLKFFFVNKNSNNSLFFAFNPSGWQLFSSPSSSDRYNCPLLVCMSHLFPSPPPHSGFIPIFY